MRLLLLAAFLAWHACGPWERTPGLRLFGQVSEEAVEDWSFVEEQWAIALETRTWYGLPHSVTTVKLLHEGELYVPSLWPEDKQWVANVLRDPRVRLKAGGRIFERTARWVENPELRDELIEHYRIEDRRVAAPGETGPEIWFLHIPRAPAARG